MQTTETNKLPKITLIYSLMDEFPEEVSLHTTNVYSYMLCKYNWFNSNKQSYYETQETIAEGCRVSLSAVKTAVRFLLKHNLITVKKVPSGKYNRNLYTVVDRYRIYTEVKPKSKSMTATKFNPMDDDDLLPF